MCCPIQQLLGLGLYTPRCNIETALLYKIAANLPKLLSSGDHTKFLSNACLSHCERGSSEVYVFLRRSNEASVHLPVDLSQAPHKIGLHITRQSPTWRLILS
jgi:hypothetical protein